MPVLMFQLTHLGSAVQFEQQAAALRQLKDLRIGYALCRQTPLEKFPEHVPLDAATATAVPLCRRSASAASTPISAIARPRAKVADHGQ
jgi:hypothetical protein